ncbi:polysaccharide deacetylase family protein [Paenibacillus yanchengensis]|uniref:Polysaccharide deacetylase family protein n=1 Tax=Paenibacillus yanchengensis TaxID=2035833 RepID=A0ABW4YMT8_9BACL
MVWKKKLTATICIVGLTILLVTTNNRIFSFMNHAKTDSSDVTVISSPMSKQDQLLYEQIQEEANKQYIAPENAKIDRVWKAIPGYNGLKIDVDKTFELARLNTKNSLIPYQYVEVKPEIQLSDLGAHPVYRGNSQKKMVSLLINVAWGNEYLDSMLQTLRDKKVKTTFFLDGSWLKKYPEVAKQIQQEGHEISNHAYSHPDMATLSRQNQNIQIEKTEQLLQSILKVNNKWFAPPSGSFNQTTVDVAKQQGLQTILWTLDTVDWKKPPASQIVNKIRSNVDAGTLILMHPTASSRDALAQMIEIIEGKGLKIGPVSETLSSDRT